ncbi:MAG: hypothetical protein HC925_00545 [Coleofasciculaceae cyanobacterium SM2_3_26]|nr:hypothetical protein [Coleofasciculaceae cyanobacterium SM2_3_26]
MSDDDDKNSVRSVPKNITQSILVDVSQRINIAISEITIVEATRQTWSDGCLGLGGDGMFCTEALVSGWEVVAVGGDRVWVYRTDLSGSSIKWDVSYQPYPYRARPSLQLS